MTLRGKEKWDPGKEDTAMHGTHVAIHNFNDVMEIKVNFGSNAKPKLQRHYSLVQVHTKLVGS